MLMVPGAICLRCFLWSGFPLLQCKFQEFCVHRLCEALCEK